MCIVFRSQGLQMIWFYKVCDLLEVIKVGFGVCTSSEVV